MKCRCCDKPLSDAELQIDGRQEGVPDDFCFICRSISRDPDFSDQYYQGLDYTIWDLDITSGRLEDE